MVKIITLNEIKNYLLSMRVLLLNFILLFLTIANIVFSVKNYESNELLHNAYILENNALINNLSNSISDASFENYTIIRKNNPLPFISSDNFNLPNGIELNILRIIDIKLIKKENFLFNANFSLDWLFIVGVILSFFALILTFDSVNGDKNNGILKLNFSNSISRNAYLFSKYLSRFVLIFIPFLVYLLITIVIFQIKNSFYFDFHEYTVILIFIILSAIYISIFIFMGIVFSMLHRNIHKSMLTLLLIWVSFILIIPSLSKINLLSFSPVKNRNNYEQEIKSKSKEYDDMLLNLRDRTLTNKIKILNEKSNIQDELLSHHVHDILSNIYNARNIQRISPYSVFRFIIESINSTGIRSFDYFFSNSREYKTRIFEYLRSEDAKDPNSLHLFCEVKRYARVSGSSFNPESFPRYGARIASPPIESPRASILDTFILIIFLIMAVLLAIIFFQRQELV